MKSSASPTDGSLLGWSDTLQLKLNDLEIEVIASEIERKTSFLSGPNFPKS